jgi:hypothetical protein
MSGYQLKGKFGDKNSVFKIKALLTAVIDKNNIYGPLPTNDIAAGATHLQMFTAPENSISGTLNSHRCRADTCGVHVPHPGWYTAAPPPITPAPPPITTHYHPLPRIATHYPPITTHYHPLPKKKKASITELSRIPWAQAPAGRPAASIAPAALNTVHSALRRQPARSTWRTHHVTHARTHTQTHTASYGHRSENGQSSEYSELMRVLI